MLVGFFTTWKNQSRKQNKTLAATSVQSKKRNIKFPVLIITQNQIEDREKKGDNMNEFIKLYEELLNKFSEHDRDIAYITITSVIALVGTIDDLRELNDYYHRQFLKIKESEEIK